MKRIILCFDGTSHGIGAGGIQRNYSSHVVNLVQRTPHIDVENVQQIVYYFAGVGSLAGPKSKLSAFLEKNGAAPFAWGFYQKISEAVLQLALNYEAGDEVYLFGWSRGSYTAFLVAWFLNLSGVPPREQIQNIDAMLSRFFSIRPNIDNESIESFEFRAAHSPAVAVSASEVEWRRENGFEVPALLQISFFGAWDTVIGMPDTIGRRFRWKSATLRPLAYLDGQLPSIICGARHALAFNEERIIFNPMLWDNTASLNGRSSEFVNGFRQCWMPGDHSTVAGGGTPHVAQLVSLLWVLEGAESMGLSLNIEELRDEVAQIDDTKLSTANWRSRKGFFGYFLRGKRDLGDEATEFHLSIR